MVDERPRVPRRYNNDLPTGEAYITWEHLEALALAVGVVIRKYKAIERFRQMVRCWLEEWLRSLEAETEFRKRRAEYAQVLLATPDLRDEAVEMDQSRWRFEPVRVQSDGDHSTPRHVAGWVPENLWSEYQPEAGLPLPVPDCEVTLAEKYAALSAIYDGASKGVERIDPFDNDKMDGAVYWSLTKDIRHLPESDEKHIRVWLEEVAAGLSGAETQPLPSDRRTSGAEAKSPQTRVISKAVALQRFIVSDSTIRKHAREGKLTDHRSPDSKPNAEYQFDESELERLYTRRARS